MRKIRRVPSSIDNMKPGSPLVLALSETPIDERVKRLEAMASGIR